MNVSNFEISESLLKNVGVPNLDSIMGGYTLDGGKMKANINYWDSRDINMSIDQGIILLYNDISVYVGASSINIMTTLTLEILPPTIAFIYFFTDNRFVSVKFRVKSVDFGKSLYMGSLLGYGFFIPILPFSNIKFNKQENAT
jgi:hypothetical protein